MLDFFPDTFSARDNRLSRIDSRVKLLLALELLLLVVVSQHIIFPLAVLAFCFCTLLALRVPWRMVLMRIAAPIGMVLVLVAVQSVLRGVTPLWVLNLGAWKIVVTKEGLHFGLLSGARVFGSVRVVVLLGMVTPIHQLFKAMRWMGVPQGWVEIAGLMYRYMFTVLLFAVDMTSAQRMRLGYEGVRRGMSSMQTMIGTVILRSMDQAINTHEAMTLRGYQGAVPFAPIPPMTLVQTGVIIGVSLFASGIWVVFERNIF